MSHHQALEEVGGLNLIRIAVVKDLTATAVGFFIFNHKITPLSTQKTAGLKTRKQ